MMDLNLIRDSLQADMAAGAKAMHDDFVARTLSVAATCFLLVFFLPYHWVLFVACAIALSELIVEICVRTSRNHFSLKLYTLWALCNLVAAFTFCSFAMMLIAQPSLTSTLLGAMILIGCLTQPLIVGVSSIALSYGCLMAPLVSGWAITFSYADTDSTRWALTAGLAILTLHSIMVTHTSRSVMGARNEAQAQADAAAAAKTRFMTAMSHEIRTPLNGIMGIAQMNRDRAVTPDDVQQADLLLSTSESLKHLLDDILDQAKLEAGQMKLSKAPEDMRDVVNQVVSLFHANAEAKNLELRIDFPPSDIALDVEIDRLRMGQVLSNLLSNAIKFTDQGSIMINTRLHDRPGHPTELCVRVSDTGRGMSHEETENLFQDFSQVGEQNNRSTKGTGLGLAISRGLARAMGGDLTVTSARGKGSEFTLCTPCARVEKPEDPESDGSTMPPDLSEWRILAVDDNKANRYIVSSFLNVTGADVTVLDGGVAAVDFLASNDVDLVLLDINMPDMDGPAVFDEIVDQHVDTLRPKVVALTAHSSDDARRSYVRMGMDGYLSKPISKQRLFAELARLGVQAPKPNPAKI